MYRNSQLVEKGFFGAAWPPFAQVHGSICFSGLLSFFGWFTGSQRKPYVCLFLFYFIYLFIYLFIYIYILGGAGRRVPPEKKTHPYLLHCQFTYLRLVWLRNHWSLVLTHAGDLQP